MTLNLAQASQMDSSGKHTDHGEGAGLEVMVRYEAIIFCHGSGVKYAYGQLQQLPSTDLRPNG